MSAVDEVMKEREEAKVREVFDTLDGILAEIGTNDPVVRWTAQFRIDGKVYQYAALLTNGAWYITGRDTTGRKPEQFEAYIASLVLEAHEVVFEGTVL